MREFNQEPEQETDVVKLLSESVSQTVNQFKGFFVSVLESAFVEPKPAFSQPNAMSLDFQNLSQQDPDIALLQSR